MENTKRSPSFFIFTAKRMKTVFYPYGAISIFAFFVSDFFRRNEFLPYKIRKMQKNTKNFRLAETN